LFKQRQIKTKKRQFLRKVRKINRRKKRILQKGRFRKKDEKNKNKTGEKTKKQPQEKNKNNSGKIKKQPTTLFLGQFRKNYIRFWKIFHGKNFLKIKFLP